MAAENLPPVDESSTPESPLEFACPSPPDLLPRRRPRRSLREILVTFIVHHNPFYLLSALSMIAGCYALNMAMEVHPGEISRVLILVATTGVYEILLIALGLFLIRSWGVMRDGRTLLLLQAVFLVDFTFLNSEIATANLRLGIAINALIFALALIKVGIVLRMLSDRLPVETFVRAAVMLAALFAIPSLFKWLDNGQINGRPFYAVWWIVGMLPVICTALCRRGAPPPISLLPRLGQIYIAMVFISVLAHLGMTHWVYRVTFYPADAAPVLLGLAVAMSRTEASRFIDAADARLIRFVFPASAVLCSIWAPPELTYLVGRGSGIRLTPVLLAGAGAYLAYVYIYFLSRAAYFLAAGFAAAIFAICGPTWTETQTIVATAWQRVSGIAWKVMPKTAVQWGFAAVGSAFALLAAGAAVSFSHAKKGWIDTPTK